MDSKNSIINEIKNYLSFINEDFLISITNKGIYNRSKKDLDKIQDNIIISLTEKNEIEVKIEENTVVLNLNIQNSICTCPSSNVCKHIIISLLYLKKYYEENISAEETNETREEKEEIKPIALEYEALKNLTCEQALEWIGKKNYNALIRSVQIEKAAVFDYEELLTVTLKNQNEKVYFPKENSIENAMCSCKEKGMCKHKAYALISYLLQERNLDLSPEEDKVMLGKKEEEFLTKIQSYIAMLLDTGLSSLTDGEIKRIEKLYIQAYGMNFFYIANELKSLSGEFVYYFNKNVSFSNSRLYHILCGIYNRARAILLAKENSTKRAVLIGVRKEESYILNQSNLIGLGAACRLTKRKDLLLNAYFYCLELKKMIVMSTLRPFENNGVTPEYLYNGGLVWSEDVSFHTACISKILLKQARFSSGKVSGAKSTICNIKEKTKEEDIQSFVIKDYSLLKQELEKRPFQYFEPYSEADNIFLIKSQKIENISFDKVNQKLNFISFDEKGNTITFEIKYSPVTETAIKYLEKNKDRKLFEYILGNITNKNEQLIGSFLSGISQDGVKNIFFKG